MKKPVISLGKQLRSGILAYVICRNTHVPPPPPGSAQPPSRHGPPSRPGPPGPLQPSDPAPATEFARAQYRFFSGHTGFFPRVREQSKNSVQKEKSLRKLTYWIAVTSPAVPRRTELRAQAPCWTAAFCMYRMLHKPRQLSQISMRTLTVIPSRGSFGFFRITSSGCCGISAAPWRREYDEVRMRLSGCSGLKEVA